MTNFWSRFFSLVRPSRYTHRRARESQRAKTKVKTGKIVKRSKVKK